MQLDLSGATIGPNRFAVYLPDFANGPEAARRLDPGERAGVGKVSAVAILVAREIVRRAFRRLY